MATAVADNHLFIVLLSLILVYFLWMDLALYYKLQSGWGDLLIVQTYASLNSTATAPLPRVATSSAPLAHRPAKMAFFDPFNPISVKLLMVDHANHYVYYSLCWWLDTHVLHIADRLAFITPDMISLSHVVVSAVGARLIVTDALAKRRVGVVLFELRSMLDSYDGMVARARRHQHALTQANGGWGYWMDGICDAVGTVFFFCAAWALLQKRSLPSARVKTSSKTKAASPSTLSVSMSTLHGDVDSRRGSTENLVAVEEASPFLALEEPAEHNGAASARALSLLRAATVTVLALLGQQFISSFLWNRYMHEFHELIEVPYKVMVNEARDFQVSTLKSSPFWIICWTWKLLNPHSMLSFLLILVFFDVAGPIFYWLRYIGYVPILMLGLFSEAYMQTVMRHSFAQS